MQEVTMVYLSTSSIFGTILFNVYLHELSESSTGKCLQFSGGTTLYRHCKVKDITEIARLLVANLNTLESWSKKPNLVFNTEKTKTILFWTRQMSQNHNVDNTELYTIRSKKSKYTITERVVTWKVLGKKFHQNSSWKDEIFSLIIEGYRTLKTLKKSNV